MTFEDDAPIPEPRSDLVPPVHPAPAAAGGDTPSAEARPPSVVRAEMQRWPPVLAFLDHALTLAFDVLDAAGDAVAERLGIRRAAGEPPPSAPPPD
jgi:hypothetical protein